MESNIARVRSARGDPVQLAVQGALGFEAFMVELEDEIFVINSAGTVIRMEVRGITSQGRDATGVRVMGLDDGQVVAAVAPVLQSEE